MKFPAKARWDYHSEVRLYEESGVILTGICTEAKQDEEGNLHLMLAGPFWKLERTRIGSFETFGMEEIESLYWLVRLSSPDRPPVFPVLELDTDKRPFMYTIPLRGLSELNKGLFLAGDTEITSQENDNVFNQVLEGSESIKEEEAWNQGCPRVFGVVFAQDLIQAENLALERATSMVGIINFALTTGMSHFDTRYSSEQLHFDGENNFSAVSPYPWIAIREVNEIKGWIRHTAPVKLEPNETFDPPIERIQFFLSKFFNAGQPGDIYDQTGQRRFPDREEKLLTRTGRALHWLNIASDEEDIRDKFAAIWISLESILNSIKYPGVFDGERASVKKSLRRGIKEIDLPTETSALISITTNMLLNRVLQNQWPIASKLSIFANAFGIAIERGDIDLVGKLGRARGNVFHEGENNPDITSEQVFKLKHLVERLITATSIGGYEDLEDRPHKFRFGEIGPEGGGAPLSIDGKDVDWEAHMYRDADGEAIVEWVAEGKIYTQENIHLEGPRDNS